MGRHSIAADKRKTCWQAPGTSWNTDLHFKQPSKEVLCKATTRRGMRRGVGDGWNRAGGWGGRSPSQPSSTVWLSRSLAQMLLSLYKLFTSGYTKGNSAALIVAEGKFSQKIKHSSTTPANVCKSYNTTPRTHATAYAVCTQGPDCARNAEMTQCIVLPWSRALLLFWSPEKTPACAHQQTQMASQKLRETSNVLWRNMNQYILTRIKCASVEPFGLSKTAFLLMSKLFIFLFSHGMIRYTAMFYLGCLPAKM